MNFEIELGEEEAWALAQLLKRMGWSDWRALAANEEETATMRRACEQLRRQLGEQGCEPR